MPLGPGPCPHVVELHHHSGKINILARLWVLHLSNDFAYLEVDIITKLRPVLLGPFWKNPVASVSLKHLVDVSALTPRNHLVNGLGLLNSEVIDP